MLGVRSYLSDSQQRGTYPPLIKPADYWSWPEDREPSTSSQEMDCHYPYSPVMNLTCGDWLKSSAAWHLLSCLMHSKGAGADELGWYTVFPCNEATGLTDKCTSLAPSLPPFKIPQPVSSVNPLLTVAAHSIVDYLARCYTFWTNNSEAFIVMMICIIAP